MFKSKVFRKQMYCVEESTCEIFKTFPRPRSDLAPHSDSAPGELCTRYSPTPKVKSHAPPTPKETNVVKSNDKVLSYFCSNGKTRRNA